MKKFFLIIVSLIAISCKSQTVSLETAAQCSTNPNCPDYNYVKDLNNSLEKFIGTWKGTYAGKIYEVKFNKSVYEDFGIKKDQITGRLRITTIPLNGIQGTTIYNNFSEVEDNKTRFTGLGFTSNLIFYEMNFFGPFTSGCINSGSIFIKIKPNNPNQMSILYWSDKDIVVGDCPNNFTQTFPEKQTIILTKE